MNSTSEVSIHGPATARTATAAMILGTNDSVASWICVAAWKMLTTRPTASTVSSSGAETISSIQRLCWPRVKTCCGSIASAHEARGERAEEQVPAVGEHEQHQLEGQRDEHRRQHHQIGRGLVVDPSLQLTKLEASEPRSRFQPSASTNSISLKGSEMSTGDSIIMPSDIRTLATIMSMMRKGRKTRKPIWKALFSSLVTNAGTSTLNGTSAVFTDGSILASLAKSMTSAWRVCFIMKSRTGLSPRRIASSKAIWFAA